MTRISRDDLAFLLRVLDLPRGLRDRIESAMKGHTELTIDDADALRDLCGERLQTHGFGPGYVPTEEGGRLERLIDELFIG